MKKIYLKVFIFVIVLFGLTFAYKAQAIIPTLSISNYNNLVTINVNGDANSSVYLYYNTSYGNQNTYLGMTNSYGYLSTTVSQNNYNIVSGSSVYVTVNGQNSSSYSWPSSYTNTNNQNNSVLSLSSLTLPLGGVATLNSINNQSIYVNSNSNSSVVSTSSGNTQPVGCTSGAQYSYVTGAPCYYNYNYNYNYNNSVLDINALSVGTASLSVCSNSNSIYSSNCSTLTVNVIDKTYNNIYSNTGSVLGSCYFSSNLRYGMRSSDVYCLQSSLVNLGFLSNNFTSSYFDINTLNAVVSFQRSRGLYPDGIVGPRTRTEIFKLNY